MARSALRHCVDKAKSWDMPMRRPRAGVLEAEPATVEGNARFTVGPLIVAPEGPCRAVSGNLATRPASKSGVQYKACAWCVGSLYLLFWVDSQYVHSFQDA